MKILSSAVSGESKLLFLTPFFLFFLLRILNLDLAESQGRHGVSQYTAGAEVDALLLDERSVIVFFGERTLTTEGNLERAKFTQTDDFTVLNRFLYHVFQCNKYGIHIGLVDGTSGLDTFRYFTNVYITRACA